MLLTKDEFKAELAHHKANIWQTEEWGNYQTNLGKTVFSVKADKWISLIVKQNLPFKQNYLEVQRGPLGFYDETFFSELKEIAKEEGSAFVRISSEHKLHYNGVSLPSTGNHFPETTLIVDLKQSEEEILKGMKQKGRYNIRLAQKKGVKVSEEKDSQKASEIFFKLVKETTERDGFSGHNQETYKEMIDSLGSKLKVLVAYFEDEPIAAGIFTFCGTQAIYYYGASSNEFRNLMAPYLIQWEAIQIAKKLNCESYDFLGIAKDENDKSDPWFGITQFKLKFGGEIVNYPKAFDIPVNWPSYLAYRLWKILDLRKFFR